MTAATAGISGRHPFFNFVSFDLDGQLMHQVRSPHSPLMSSGISTGPVKSGAVYTHCTSFAVYTQCHLHTPRVSYIQLHCVNWFTHVPCGLQVVWRRRPRRFQSGLTKERLAAFPKERPPQSWAGLRWSKCGSGPRSHPRFQVFQSASVAQAHIPQRVAVAQVRFPLARIPHSAPG